MYSFSPVPNDIPISCTPSHPFSNRVIHVERLTVNLNVSLGVYRVEVRFTPGTGVSRSVDPKNGREGKNRGTNPSFQSLTFIRRP